MKTNENYMNLTDNYLFAHVSQKVRDYKARNPDSAVISLGIGDVTLPLAPAVVGAMLKAVAEMGRAETFRGYGDYEGYIFLRRAICDYYFKKGVMLGEDEVFVGDGAKSDLGNILDIFSADNSVLIQNPVYPVYADTNIMAARRIKYLDGNKENAFLPQPDYAAKADIIYLCSPNNPTGAVYDKKQLGKWVEYARSNDAIILFDSAYEAFVRDEELPTSIFQIDGARDCAIEFCSLSKTAGFTGVRCGYTVIPRELTRCGESLGKLWLRRQATKFNGVSYIVQRGAQAAFSEEGIGQIAQNIDYYRANAEIIAEALSELDIWFTGGNNSPYIWMGCPDNMTSWNFFDYLLEKAQIVGTPGTGFGAKGEGFFRLTAFGDRADVTEAMKRLSACL